MHAFCRHSPQLSRKNRGVTLTEIILVLAIAMVLLRIAVPRYDSLVNDGRLTAVTNDLIGAVHLARTEAVKRSINVSVCAGNADLSACGNTASWNNGWLVLDGNGEILLRRAPLEDVFTMRDSAAAAPPGNITFNSMGFTPLERAIEVCGPNGEEILAKAVRVTRPGEVRMAGDTNGNNIPEPLRGGADLVCS